MKNIFINLKNKSKLDEINGLLIIWLVSSLLTYIGIEFFEMKLDALGDAVGGIFGTLISTVVLIFVIQSYKLQKQELIKTTEALEGQEESMRDQKLQTMIISLLELSRNHLIEFKDTLEKAKFCTPNGKDLISLYIQNNPNIPQDGKDGILNNAIYYFRTLKYIEHLIIRDSGGNKEKIKIYIDLLESQITENLRILHSLLIGSKEGVEKNSIIFEHLFNNNPAYIEKPTSVKKRTVKVF